MQQKTLCKDWCWGKLLLGVLYISIAVAIAVALTLTVSLSNKNSKKVLLRGEEIVVTIVDTPALREQGLSGYKSLGTNEGMLFVFDEPSMYRFWMKDMRFPIDIIWFDENKKIVDVWEKARPDSYPEARMPKAPALYVLEVNAGYYEKNHLKNGDVLELKL